MSFYSASNTSIFCLVLCFVHQYSVDHLSNINLASNRNFKSVILLFCLQWNLSWQSDANVFFFSNSFLFLGTEENSPPIQNGTSNGSSPTVTLGIRRSSTNSERRLHRQELAIVSNENVSSSGQSSNLLHDNISNSKSKYVIINITFKCLDFRYTELPCWVLKIKMTVSYYM